MRIAVVGSGISGLAAARALTGTHSVTVFEAQAHAGGHAHAVDISMDGQSFPVDTGFLVLNEKTYPKLLELFEELKVPLATSDMSFSASLRPSGVEWAGTNLRSLFCQPDNLASPRFLRMLIDIARFNHRATRLAQELDSQQNAMPLGQWLDDNHFGGGFRNWYLLPMAAAIWSCPIATMREFPIGSFVRFFHNHGLLQLSRRPQWYTVAGSSRNYVRRIVDQLSDIRLRTPVRRIERSEAGAAGGVQIHTDYGVEAFDAVVLACHSTQSLSLLAQPSDAEQRLLGAIRFQPNTAWLHTDDTLMPRSRKAWAAWNYLAQVDGSTNSLPCDGQARVSLTYWLNKLQALPCTSNLLLTMNPLRPPRKDTILGSFDYEHPVLDAPAIAAQQGIELIQGRNGTWYCGAWLGYGFHEDGLGSALRAVDLITRKCAADSGAQVAGPVVALAA